MVTVGVNFAEADGEMLEVIVPVADWLLDPETDCDTDDVGDPDELGDAELDVL